MQVTRRDTLKAGAAATLLAATGSAASVRAAEADWNKNAFEAKTVADVLKALGGGSVEKSSAVVLTAPDIAENGAVVPVAVSANILGADQIAILVDKNPNILSGEFTLPAGTEAFVSTRVKMAQTSNVQAWVRAGGKWYAASKEVKVTIGGCGGCGG
ncbi:MAG: thiosulfate oxidation carrier protein SoxY [Candidatus Protistobacter heckmanni]|nr:thiosulfate oxidation carrier protein SoxY [Candidatus Protistobacter heckmanni]